MFRDRFIFVFLLILAGLVFFYSDAKAVDSPSSWGNFQCTRHGQQKDCPFSYLDYDRSVDSQLYKFDIGFNYTGYGSAGSMRVDVCMHETAGMWQGACWVVFSQDYGEVFRSGEGSRQLVDLT